MSDNEEREIQFLTLCVEGENVPETHELIKRYGEIFDSRNRPWGDDYDQQFEVMLLETATSFNIDYIVVSDEIVAFHPLGYDKDMVRKAIMDFNSSQQ